MRLWEFPDEYVIEPTDGSSGSPLSVSRVDGSMKLLGLCFPFFFVGLCVIWLLLHIYLFWVPDGVPECSSLRVPKIRTIFGVVGMLKLVAGNKNVFDSIKI